MIRDQICLNQRLCVRTYYLNVDYVHGRPDTCTWLSSAQAESLRKIRLSHRISHKTVFENLNKCGFLSNANCIEAKLHLPYDEMGSLN